MVFLGFGFFCFWGFLNFLGGWGVIVVVWLGFLGGRAQRSPLPLPRSRGRNARRPPAVLPAALPARDDSWSLLTKPRPPDGPSERWGAGFFFFFRVIWFNRGSAPQRRPGAGEEPMGTPRGLRGASAAPGATGREAPLERAPCVGARRDPSPQLPPPLTAFHIPHAQPRPPPTLFLSSKPPPETRKKFMGKIRLVPWTLLTVQPEIYIFASKKRESLSSH